MLEEFSIRSKLLNMDRMIRVCLPEEYYGTNTEFPVLYMHDGQNLFRDESATYGTCWGIKDYLGQSNLKVIVVGIDCNSEGFERLNEYAPWVNVSVGEEWNVDEVLGGRGHTYIDFIVNELKPYIDNRYRTLANDSSMAGSSMGGLISTYAACRYPMIFRKIAAISSAFWFNQKEIEELISSTDLSEIRKFYLDVGTKEGDNEGSYQEYVVSSQSVFSLLKNKCINARFEIIEGGMHNESAWRERVPRIFEYLFNK